MSEVEATMMYATRFGRLMSEDEVNELHAWQVEHLGLHVVDDAWQEYN